MSYLIEKIGSNDIVDLPLAKSYIKVEDNHDDTVIQLLIDSSLEMIEDYLGFDLFAKKYKQFNDERLIFPIERRYLDEIISVKDEDETDVSYDLQGDWNSEIVLSGDMPERGVYTIFKTKAPDVIQEIFKTSILMQTAHMYENRGDTNIAPEVARLLAGKRLNLWL